MRLSLLCLLFSPALFAQAVLEGSVVEAGSRAPVPGAFVTVNANTGGDPALAVTDASGHFRASVADLRGLKVQVSRTGFLPRLVTLPYSAGAPSNVQVELTRQAVIAGTLEDEDGFPVARALLQVHVAGGTPLTAAGVVQSNDLGEYRIAGLPAGKYYVRASPAQLTVWDERYGPEFYPGTLEPGETGVIALSAGQERGGVDIRFTKREGVTVTGAIVMPSGVSLPGRLSLGLQLQDYSGFFRFVNVRPGTQSFSVAHVRPGTYAVRAQSGNYPPATGDWFSEQQIQVGSSDVRDVVLSLRTIEPVDLRGTVVTDRGPAPRVVIGLRGDYGPVKSTRPNEDGSFAYSGLLPGTYHVMLSPEIDMTNPRSIAPVFPISMRLGDKDVIEDGFVLNGAAPPPLRITLAGAFGTVKGTLLDSSGQPVSGGTVYVAPTQGSYSGARSGTGAKGEFIIRVPVGEYRVYAAAAADQAPFQRADYRNAHENDFPPVRIAEGENNAPLLLRLPAR